MTGTGVGPELIRLDGVDAGYGRNVVLNHVHFHVHEDQFTGIVGPSGAGKTTLLRLLLATLKPMSGTVYRRPGLRIAYVPQLETVNWNFPVTVEECVLMSRTGRRLPWAAKSEKAEAAAVLERLGIGDLGQRHIRELSGGQQQRMFLARALLRRPQLMLMDEPTSGVDVSTRHDVLHLLADLHEDGVAIHRRMHRPDRPRQTILGGDSDPVAPGLAQCGIGGDHRDGRVQRTQFAIARGVCGDLFGRRVTQPELGGELGHPRQTGRGIKHLTGRVDHDDGPDRHAGIQHR